MTLMRGEAALAVVDGGSGAQSHPAGPQHAESDCRHLLKSRDGGGAHEGPRGGGQGPDACRRRNDPAEKVINIHNERESQRKTIPRV